MPVRIRITSKQVGQARFYEQPGRQGRRKNVTTYHAKMTSGSDCFEFSVTRHTVSEVFDIQGSSPCPPTKARKPYKAWIRTDKERFRLQLFEHGQEDTYKLVGQGDRVRNAIQIHHGPGMSTGCLMVAGGKKGYTRFKKMILEMTKDTSTILVYIEKL